MTTTTSEIHRAKLFAAVAIGGGLLLVVFGRLLNHLL